MGNNGVSFFSLIKGFLRKLGGRSERDNVVFVNDDNDWKFLHVQ